MAHFKQQGWIVLESDFIFDMWLLTALKPYLPLPLLPHIWGKLIRKLMCVLPWHQWGSSNHAHPSLHAKTLTLAPPSNHSKTQGHCLFAQTIFRMTLLPALLSESLDMWVISLFMSSWCVCRVISLDRSVSVFRPPVNAPSQVSCEAVHGFAAVVNGPFFSSTVSNWSLLVGREAIDFVYFFVSYHCF